MFKPDQLYGTSDKALLALGNPSTLAHWRCEGRGPAYIRLGKRVLYRGSDLLEWLSKQVVNTRDQ